VETAKYEFKLILSPTLSINVGLDYSRPLEEFLRFFLPIWIPLFLVSLYLTSLRLSNGTLAWYFVFQP
jgi:hypothetical protein